MWPVIIFFVIHWYTSLFFQTFFHHRYAAHRMFDMSKFWEKFFFICSFIAQGSSYLSPNAYGILHRMHHAYADTKKDPHSPKFSKNVFKMMWETKDIYAKILRRKMTIENRFLKELPEWISFDNFAESYWSRIGWGVFYVVLYLVFSPPWWMYFLLPIHFVMGPFHGAIINWFAHRLGYRNWKVSNTSKNLFPFDLLMWGEGLHNNHHKFPSRANFGNKWFEFDPVYPFIKIMSWLGIIRMRAV